VDNVLLRYESYKSPRFATGLRRGTSRQKDGSGQIKQLP
jgi:hypothetical protein